MSNVKIDGVEYAPVDRAKGWWRVSEAGDDVRLVILQRGWVFVGYYHSDPETGAAWLTGARNIRRWGTTQGLGELVDGPTDETVLDPAGTVRFHLMTEVATIEADPDAWAEHLG